MLLPCIHIILYEYETHSMYGEQIIIIDFHMHVKLDDKYIICYWANSCNDFVSFNYNNIIIVL